MTLSAKVAELRERFNHFARHGEPTVGDLANIARDALALLSEREALLREARDSIEMTHHKEFVAWGLCFHGAGERPNLCTSCALLAKLYAALAEKGPAVKQPAGSEGPMGFTESPQGFTGQPDAEREAATSHSPCCKTE